MKYTVTNVVGFWAISDQDDKVVAVANDGASAEAKALVRQANAYNDLVERCNEAVKLLVQSDCPVRSVEQWKKDVLAVLQTAKGGAV